MLVNLTPHIINIVLEDGSTVNVPPSGKVARVEATFTPAGTVSGVPVYRRKFGAVIGLPEFAVDTVYIVSALVAQAAPRPDVYSPGELVRNDAGQPIGCKGLTPSE